MTKDVWQEVQLLEYQASINYATIPSANVIDWSAVGLLMQNTGMAPTDTMIANFALTIGADAILTTDSDYAPVENLIDVYMPRRGAEQCRAYDSSID